MSEVVPLKEYYTRVSDTPLIWKPGDGPIMMDYRLNYPPPTSGQVDQLLYAIDACNGKFRYQTPVEIQDKQRIVVQEWLAQL